MHQQVVVLGAGRVGSAIAVDLAKEDRFAVRVADRDAALLARLRERHGIPGERVDFSLPSTVSRAVDGADLAVSAVPGFLGYRTLRAVIEAGIDIVDISFFAEDPFALDDLAHAHGVRAIVDCGVAPGLSNLLVGHAHAQLDATEAVAIYVGGLPAEPVPPYDYRAVFSPVDVLEEYTRPARILVDGKRVDAPALSEVEAIDFEGVGQLEAFLTDGLRTLARTIAAPDMVEKTLRYPGHAEKIRLLRDTGYLSKHAVDVEGQQVRPIDVTAALLFPLWAMREGERDLTALRVVVEGRTGDRPTRWTYSLLDRYDPITRTPSMARTTGYTATMAVRLLADGLWDAAGIVPPERLGHDGQLVRFVLEGLARRGIDVTADGPLPGARDR